MVGHLGPRKMYKKLLFLQKLGEANRYLEIGEKVSPIPSPKLWKKNIYMFFNPDITSLDQKFQHFNR